MATKVWVASRGKGRKKRYFVRWREDVVDEYGHPVIGPDGKIKRRLRQEACKINDRVRARALAKQKFDELNGLSEKLRADAERRASIGELMNRDKEWLQNRLRSEGVVYLSRLTLEHLRDVLADGNGRSVHIDEVGAAEVERFIAARRAKVKPKSLNRELGNLRATFNRAVKVYGMLDRNPFAGVEMLPLDEKPIRALTPDEEAKLLNACADDLELDAFVRLGLDTGCRAGEISHLRWDAMDLDAGMGVVESTADWHTKTRRSRHIAFTPETAARLRRWRVQRAGKVFVFAEEGKPNRQHYHHIRRRFDAAVNQAGIKRCTFHDLRRTVGSLLAAQGVNQRVAAEILGHSDIRTTAKYYQAVEPETIRKAVLALRQNKAG